ncbi:MULTISPECIES: hypothetical protein [unclassified Microcoleus]
MQLSGEMSAVALGILDLKTAWEAIDPSTMFCVGNDQEFLHVVPAT